MLFLRTISVQLIRLYNYGYLHIINSRITCGPDKILCCQDTQVPNYVYYQQYYKLYTCITLYIIIVLNSRTCSSRLRHICWVNWRGFLKYRRHVLHQNKPSGPGVGSVGGILGSASAWLKVQQIKKILSLFL